MDENYRKQMLYEKNSKSIAIAYLLWLFIGIIGIHRFYTGDTKSALVRLGLCMIGIGIPVAAVLWLIDLFLIPGLVNRKNMEVIEMLNGRDEQPARLAAHDPEPLPEPEPQEAVVQLDSRRQAMLDDLRKTGYRKPRRETNPLYR